MDPGPQGLRGATLRYGVRREIVVMIGVLFLVYVVFDLVSTYWLVTNTSVGIVGEINPLGPALYRSFGYGAIIASKLIAFCLISAATLAFDSKYHSIPWFRQVEETILLSLVGISSLAALVNFGALVTEEYHRGLVQSLSPSVNLLSLIPVFGFAYLPGRLMGFQGGFKLFTAIVGAVILTSPLLYFKDVFVVALQQVPFALVAYMAAVYALVAGAIYILDELRNRADTPSAGMKIRQKPTP